jgi:hypothetical protein
MGAMIDSPWIGTAFNPPTRVDVGTIEAAIVARLRAAIGTIEVAHYPERPESWRLTHRIGAALVRYEGAKYSDPIDTASTIQERSLEFAVTLMVRDLGWAVGGPPSASSPGAYALIETVRAVLAGFVIPGCRKIRPLSEEFVKRDADSALWIYALYFGLETFAVEAPPSLDYPPFVKGIALDEGGTSNRFSAAASYTSSLSGVVQLSKRNVFAVAITGPAGALTENVDYSVDRADGAITLIGSAMSLAGHQVSISYYYADEVVAISMAFGPTN